MPPRTSHAVMLSLRPAEAALLEAGARAAHRSEAEHARHLVCAQFGIVATATRRGRPPLVDEGVVRRAVEGAGTWAEAARRAGLKPSTLRSAAERMNLAPPKKSTPANPRRKRS